MCYPESIKICVSVPGNRLGYEWNIIKKLLMHRSTYLEVRIDMGGLEWHMLEKLKEIRKKLILTIRYKDEGGKFKYNEGRRFKIFESLIEIHPLYIDIEYKSMIFDNVLNKAFNEDIGIIASYHNMLGTPSLTYLKKIYRELSTLENVDIVKIVTMANSYLDNLTVLNLFYEYDECKKPLIAFCMGKYGRISRIIAPFLGSFFIYVSFNKYRTGPGQFSFDEFNRIMRLINNEYT